jgi:hypothetical protein
MKKNKGILNSKKNSENEKYDILWEEFMIWWHTTNIIVNPLSASIYPMRDLCCIFFIQL